MSQKSSTTQLEAPGQGLPPIEAFIGRWVIMPLSVRLTSPEAAIELVSTIGSEVLALAESLSPEQRNQRALITRLQGMEDSSRHWSVQMTMEHLLITGTSMTGIIESLIKHQSGLQEVKIEDVKPLGEAPYDAIKKQYKDLLADYPNRIKQLGNLKTSKSRHPHPWFWNMTAHEWLCLNGFHHRIHLNQIKEIIKNL